MEKRIGEKVPVLKLMIPEPSTKVRGIKSAIVKGELSKYKDFGKNSE